VNVITRLGHTAIRVPDLERSVEFVQQVMGLREAARRDGVSYLTCNERHHELVLLEADELAFDHLGFEADSADDVEIARRWFAQRGYSELPHAREEGVEASVRIVGPGDFVFEVFSGMSETDGVAQAPAGSVPALGLEHATLVVRDLEAMNVFFVEVLGLEQSDRVPGAISWLRCGTRHHDFNLLAGDVDAFHHQAWEVPGIEQIGRLADRLSSLGRSLVWGPGRHSSGNGLFAYFRDNDGILNEYCAEIMTVSEDYEPVEWPNEPTTANRWGAQPNPDFLTLGIRPASVPAAKEPA
jgi:catechol 2,3-dioxygenase-like lactoylglutathione lyase family enzyme